MKISIIIPVYNGEKYIKRAVESVINQNYKDLEIIIINDGSTDNTLDVIENIKDERIKVINKENSGVSNSRNIGLDMATGDYIMFLDSDDYIESNMISKLIYHVSNRDMIICNTYEVYKNKTYIRESLNCRKYSIDKKEVIGEIIQGRLGLVCSKLVDLNVIKENNIRFDENLKRFEDQLFFLEVAAKCENFKYIKENLYYYDRRNEKSATNNYDVNLLDDYMYLQSRTEEVLEGEFEITEEDKNVLNEKLFSGFKEALRIEVINNTSIEKTLKSVGKLIRVSCEKIEFKYLNGSNILYREMIKSFKKDSSFNRLKLILLMKILIIKNG